MDTSPIVLDETNISVAWCKIMKHIIENPGMEISPLVLSLTEFRELQDVRKILDLSLENDNMDSVRTVSETIFPDSLYKYCKQDRFDLYSQYHQNLPRLKKIDPSNIRGTYFERLISFNAPQEKVNQLEIIIKSINESKVKRRSKLQAAIFDPTNDHTERPYQSFPCLQHVTFYKSDNGNLILNGFYAIQYLYRRGYGNWLGLVNLGKFIAQETDLQLERVNCFVGVEHLDKLTKQRAKKLLEQINPILNNG